MNISFSVYTLKSIILLLRPHQWTKNLLIFMPLFFSANATNIPQLKLCFYAFISFSLVASAIYCINDIIDIEDDRKHPEKSKRPVASGHVTIPTAIVLSILLLIAGFFSLLISGANTNTVIVVLLYLIFNIAYVFKIKQIAIVDVMCIASGFVIRIVVGGFAAEAALSHWIVLMTFLLALFLAFAKRRDDVLHHMQKGIITRKNIVNYNTDFLNAMLGITATITIVCYIMYTVDKTVIERFDKNQYIYVTSIFVLAAIFRYLQIAMVKEKSGSPTQILWKDKFIQICIAGWITAFVFIIYF